MTDRLTPEQIADAAESLEPRRPSLPPMRERDVLEHFDVKLAHLLADLWTLREAIDAGKPGGRTLAVSRIPALTEHLGSARDLIAQMAHDLDVRLPPV